MVIALASPRALDIYISQSHDRHPCHARIRVGALLCFTLSLSAHPRFAWVKLSCFVDLLWTTFARNALHGSHCHIPFSQEVLAVSHQTVHGKMCMAKCAWQNVHGKMCMAE